MVHIIYSAKGQAVPDHYAKDFVTKEIIEKGNDVHISTENVLAVIRLYIVQDLLDHKDFIIHTEDNKTYLFNEYGVITDETGELSGLDSIQVTLAEQTIRYAIAKRRANVN